MNYGVFCIIWQTNWGRKPISNAKKKKILRNLFCTKPKKGFEFASTFKTLFRFCTVTFFDAAKD